MEEQYLSSTMKKNHIVVNNKNIQELIVEPRGPITLSALGIQQ